MGLNQNPKSMAEIVGDLLREELEKSMNDIANEMIEEFKTTLENKLHQKAGEIITKAGQELKLTVEEINGITPKINIKIEF